MIAIRGTEGIHEWLQDAQFLLVPCPFLVGAGLTEDGFTAVYRSFTTNPAPGSPTVVKALGGLRWRKPVKTLTICGHSLGGALATLLAIDVAANTEFTDPMVYSYASPRTGDGTFAAAYNHVVKRTCRIANRLDLVPKLPPPPLYEHVTGVYDLNPVILGLPPRILLKPGLVCNTFSRPTYISSHPGGRDHPAARSQVRSPVRPFGRAASTHKRHMPPRLALTRNPTPPEGPGPPHSPPPPGFSAEIIFRLVAPWCRRWPTGSAKPS